MVSLPQLLKVEITGMLSRLSSLQLLHSYLIVFFFLKRGNSCYTLGMVLDCSGFLLVVVTMVVIAQFPLRQMLEIMKLPRWH